MPNIFECEKCKYKSKLGEQYPCKNCLNNEGEFNKFEKLTENNTIFHDIKKARHYNSHPSGVECADVTQYFDNCRGQAIQYIWRAEDKENPIRDLKKAIYWLERKIKLYEAEGLEE